MCGSLSQVRFELDFHRLTGLNSIFIPTAFTSTVKDEVELRFTNEIWNAKLVDKNSTEFRSLAAKVSNAVGFEFINSIQIRVYQNFSLFSYLKFIFPCNSLHKQPPSAKPRITLYIQLLNNSSTRKCYFC